MTRFDGSCSARSDRPPCHRGWRSAPPRPPRTAPGRGLPGGSRILGAAEKRRAPTLWSDLAPLAVIGAAAGHLALMGGGSAQVHPDHRSLLVDTSGRFGRQPTIATSRGWSWRRTTPVLDIALVVELHRGMSLTTRSCGSPARASAEVIYAGLLRIPASRAPSRRASGTFTAAVDGPHRSPDRGGTGPAPGRTADGRDHGLEGSRPTGSSFFGAGRAESVPKSTWLRARPCR